MFFANKTEDMNYVQQKLQQAKSVALDTETNSDKLLYNNMWAALRVISLGVRFNDGTDESIVIDVRDIPTQVLAKTLSVITKPIVAWNANFDSAVLKEAGLGSFRWFDAMLADAVLFGGRHGFVDYHSLAKSVKYYLGVDMVGKGTVQLSFDSRSDLTPEQITYAAEDALLTLRVAEEILRRVKEANLLTAVKLEQAARPFIAKMIEKGLHLDTEGWDKVLAQHEERKNAALEVLARLSNESVDSLSWRPTSDVETKEVLNKFAPDLIKVALKKTELGKTDKLDKTFLLEAIQKATLSGDPKAIAQSEFASALLTFRSNTKILTTYGTNLYSYLGPDRRLHPVYKQAITATGRLLSLKPNAQNLSPALKPYIKPASEDVVYVMCDLSQAEVRVLAHLSGEEAMIQAFTQKADFHESTAARMFGVDMAELATSNPSEYTRYRKTAKGITFGIPYGLGAAALARKLTLETGREVTTEDAKKLLETYLDTYPSVARWLEESDNTVADLANRQHSIDWELTLRLVLLKNKIKEKKTKLNRSKDGVTDEVEAIAQMLLADTYDADLLAEKAEKEKQVAAARKAVVAFNRKTESAKTKSVINEATLVNNLATIQAELEVLTRKLQASATGDLQEVVNEIEWANSFDSAVVLDTNGEPFSFESRTKTNRRRLFQIPMNNTASNRFDGIIINTIFNIAFSRNPIVQGVWSNTVVENNLKAPLTPKRTYGTADDARKDIVKALEGKNSYLKMKIIADLASIDKSLLIDELDAALKSQIRSKSNAFRNVRIQSLVADIMLLGFDMLWEKIGDSDTIFPVQSVHDSIVLECPVSKANELSALVKGVMEDALETFCPSVVAKADVEIAHSLKSDGTVIELISEEDEL